MMAFKMARTIGVLTFAASLAAPVSAATVFNDSASYSAAAGSVTNVDFQGCPPTTQALGTNVTVSNSGPCAGVPGGVTFSPPTSNGLYIAGAGQSANPTTALGLNTPSGGALAIAFGALQTSFGTDLFQNFGGGFQSGQPAVFTLAFFNNATLLNTYSVNVASGTGGFFGVTEASAFNGVRISQAGGFAVIDNVKFGVGAVPEPATWAMMLLGFGGIGFAMRRRKSKITTKVSFA